MNVLELFKPVRTFVFGVEGVITDNAVFCSEQGQELYRTNSRDAFAMQMAMRKGYRIWVISHNKLEAISSRLSEAGISEMYFGVHDKKTVLKDLVTSIGGGLETALYMADDIPDHAAMQLCLLPCCPADAVEEIKAVSKYISPFRGGCGCVRDVIEKVLKLNGDWELPV